MTTSNFIYAKLTDMTVGIQSQPDRDLRMLSGKVLLNEAESRLLFVQNKPRGPRSREKMRTAHSRLVQTPQGSYTLTFRFWPSEKGLWGKLMDEMLELRSANENESTNNQEGKEERL